MTRDELAPTDLSESQLAVAAPPSAAGGLEALTTTFKHLRQGSGVVRGARALLVMNQEGGFDCPGCAWPEPKTERSRFEFCENGAKAIAHEANPRQLDGAFFSRYSVEQLREKSEHWLGRQGRLSVPLLLEPGATHYRAVSWDHAFQLAGDALRGLSSPDRAVFYTSGRTSNEAAFLYQLFARVLGTNNLPDCSNLCHESSGYALKRSIGVGKGTVQLEDFALADVILVIGQNPGTNHPRMMTQLQTAARRGCRIVSINPLPEVALTRFVHPQTPWEALGGGTAIASLHLPVRVGGDVALLTGVMKHLLARHESNASEGVDRAFIEQHTVGFEQLASDLRAAAWDELERGSGITRVQMQDLAQLLGSTQRIIACWAMGLTQHVHAVDNISAITNLLLMRGALGRPGAGLCPVRGHSNVQGDRTMGITSQPSAEQLRRLAERYAFAPPQEVGYDAIAAIEAMGRGDVDVFVGLGGNFAAATPDTQRTEAALARCGLTIQISTTLNRSHLATGRQALILPCLGRSERDVVAGVAQFVSVEDSMSTVHRSEGQLDPVSSELLSEPALVSRLAAATLDRSPRLTWEVWGSNYDTIRDEIAAMIPGFENFNGKVREPGGFTLDNAARRRVFHTASGRAEFVRVESMPNFELEPGQLLLMTIRSHDQYNTTVYGLDDRYRGVRGGRRVVFVNPEDLQERGLAPGSAVDLWGWFRGEKRVALDFSTVAYDLPRGVTAAYFPETNGLVPLEAHARGSRTPASKSVVIELRPRA